MIEEQIEIRTADGVSTASSSAGTTRGPGRA